MKALIILMLACFSAAAVDIGIQSFSSATTNSEPDTILTTDIYTRGGQTNLIRVTKSKHGTVVFRSHQFLHHGEPVSLFTWRNNVLHYHTYQNTSYYADLEFTPSKDVRCVILMGHGCLDGFYCTNGIFYPAPDSDLEMKDVK
ncbi:MAG TPA: hypothetical protein VG347_09485 [Verrucomicrobiae bacterium]|nr:hypothetical protein [Verrucomicrobiae bacterium]